MHVLKCAILFPLLFHGSFAGLPDYELKSATILVTLLKINNSNNRIILFFEFRKKPGNLSD